MLKRILCVLIDMLFLYSVFILFFGWYTAIKYHKSNKKGLLVNEFTNKHTRNLFCILVGVFIVSLLILGFQSYDLFYSILNFDVEEIVDLPDYIEKFSSYFNIGVAVLKSFMIPAKIMKFLLRLLFTVLSVFIFYSHYCLRKAISLPKYLRNILYGLCVADVIYVLVAIF